MSRHEEAFNIRDVRMNLILFTFYSVDYSFSTPKINEWTKCDALNQHHPKSKSKFTLINRIY